jgi:hypothetical protein
MFLLQNSFWNLVVIKKKIKNLFHFIQCLDMLKFYFFYFYF